MKHVLGHSLTSATLYLALITLPGPVIAQPTDTAQDTQVSELDPQALVALDAMGKSLRGLKQFTLTSDTSIDVVLETGQKIELDGKTTYKVQQPGRMFVELDSDRVRRQLFFDGKSLTVYAPRLKYYAITETAASTLGDLAIAASTKYGIELPLTDLFFWGTEYVTADRIKAALYIGPATINGERVDQYAFRQDGIDWQVWLSEQGHLPRKIVVTSTDDPAMPQYQARLFWDTNTPVDASVFNFIPPEGTNRIEIVPLDLADADSSREQ